VHGIFLQAAAYDGLQLARTDTPPLDGRSLARQHFVKDQTERVDVGAGIRRSAFPLLRRHISRRAHDHSFSGDRWISFERRQAEIQDLCADFGQHDVAGLQIAVDDALLVRFRQRRGDVLGVTDRLFDEERPVFQPSRDRLPFHQFHYQVIGTNVVKRADVGVVQ
jgi:hypothetical protein